MLWLRIEGARSVDACVYADCDIRVSGMMWVVLICFGAVAEVKGVREDGGHIVGE